MENSILTKREMEVINKKIHHKKLNQLDSNILTRTIRPKLKQIMNLDAESLLKKLSYNPAYKSIENKIKRIILSNINKIEAIILVGSAAQTNYTDYNDLDIIIITKIKIWDKKLEREEIISNLEEKAKKINLNLDIQIISKKVFLESYPKNPSLIYQLKDNKIIYGNVKIPKKIGLSKMDLLMKLDWSELSDTKNGKEIYEGIRNLWLVRLLMNKIIDNSKHSSEIISELGRELILKLKNNTASSIEKKMAVEYLLRMISKTEKEIKEAKWERIEL